VLSKNNVFGFISGIGCGVGIALLLAPISGRDARSRIANGVREKTDRLKSQAVGLRDSATQALQKGQDEYQRHMEGLKHAVEAGVQAYQSSTAVDNEAHALGAMPQI
jgi:gas vesicle protein